MATEVFLRRGADTGQPTVLVDLDVNPPMVTGGIGELVAPAPE
ncbi:hypothetical protein OHB12_08185 [Nocardia sp. NBC_01730]|nr:hypothetical protein OHB12_08185 [Nocardia sp. NBC_01730]